MADKEKQSFDKWILRETDVLNRLHRYVEDTVKTAREKASDDDYDSIDALLDILAATVVSELRDYFEEEYEIAYSEGIDGRIESEADEMDVYTSIYADVDGKTFAERVEEYVNELYAPLMLVTDDESMEEPSNKLQNALDLIAESDGHRVRSEARQAAGEELASVGYTVMKKWRTMLDEKVRYTHTELEGKTIPIDGWFETINGRAQHPGGFGVPEEDCRCRCVLEIIATLEG